MLRYEISLARQRKISDATTVRNNISERVSTAVYSATPKSLKMVILQKDHSARANLEVFDLM